MRQPRGFPAIRFGLAVLIIGLMVGFGSVRSDRYDVTIHRDEWGVPHIYGATDAGVVFGAAYAQAEDNWPQVRENFLRAIGRGAEILGAEAVLDDYLARALEIPRRSILEYERAPAEIRELYDAYAAGFNHWIETRKGDTTVGEPLLGRVEPWHTLALIRFKYHHNEYLGYAGLSHDESVRWLEQALVVSVDNETRGLQDGASAAAGSDVPRAFQRERSPDGRRATGSNEWALAGSRTASGYPMLLINPHVSFFGLSQYTEVHLHSEQGLVFSGLTRFGFMLPYMGNSEVLGWAYTDNYGDYNDLYWLDLDVNGQRYRYGDGWRELRRWEETLTVKEGDGPRQRTYRFAASHHGPIVGIDEDGRPLAVRLAKLDEGGWFEQWYGMMRARSHDEWVAELARLNVPYMNTMYADTAGNIHYIYNHAVPRRSTDYDWSEPVDGSDPGAEWAGYHPLEQLPQYLNPEGGWLQNTNSDPLQAAPGGGLDRQDFPAYMIGNESHNARAVSSVRVLEGLDDVTLDDFARAVLDTRLSAADAQLPRLFADLEALESEDAVRAARLADPVRRLREWDRRSSIGSVATTLFVRWAEALARGSGSDEAGRVSALERVVAALEDDWGTWEVPWGELNRLQRPDAAGREPFSDELPSLAVAGAPGWLGSVFTFHTRTAPDGKRGYGVHGNSFVKVIEFTPRPRARSLWVFGQSARPESPHYFDQAELYSQRRFKVAWFARSEVEANTQRTVRLQYRAP